MPLNGTHRERGAEDVYEVLGEEPLTMREKMLEKHGMSYVGLPKTEISGELLSMPYAPRMMLVNISHGVWTIYIYIY